MSLTQFNRRLPVALLLASLALSQPVAAGDYPDVLQRPAKKSDRVLKSPLFGVTRAGTRLVAVGDRGHIVVSEDNGANWKQVEVPVSSAIVAVRFVGADAGWAVGHDGVILHTTNGGRSWVRQFDGLMAGKSALEQVKSRSEATPKVLAEAQALVDAGADKPFLDLWFGDSAKGFVIGAYGLFFTTEDGGVTWQYAAGRLDNPRSLHLYAIAADSRRLFIVGEAGGIHRSLDGGKSFERLAAPYKGTFFGVALGPGNRVLIHGLRGHAFESSDNGDSWRRVDIPTQYGLTASLRMNDGSILVADQAGQLFRRADDGGDFVPLAQKRQAPIAAMALAADGRVVTAGLGGLGVLPANLNDAGKK